MRSRRIERALACLAGIVLLTDAFVAHESEQPAAIAQAEPSRIPAFAGLIEHQDVVAADGEHIAVRFLLGSRSAINDRIRTTTKEAIERLVAWFGPLPSPLTIVDAPWSDRASCASSPGLVVVSSRWLQPELEASLERALIAALARQPFLKFATTTPSSEVFAQALGRFAAVRAINDTLDGRHVLSVRHFGGFVPYQVKAIALSRRRSDPRPFVHEFGELHSPGCASPQRTDAAEVRVGETTIALLSLERAIGWPALQQAIAALVDRFRGRAPQPADLLTIVAEQRGGAPSSMFSDALSGRASIDGAIEAFTSEPGDARGAFRTIVRARLTTGTAARSPDAEHPATETSVPAIPLTVRFADGEVVREWLDTRRPEVTLEYDSPTAAVEASVDPDTTLLFDGDRGNNTRVPSPRLPPTAVRRLLNWLVWLQDLALTGTALV